MSTPGLDLVVKNVRAVRPGRPEVAHLDLGVKDGSDGRLDPLLVLQSVESPVLFGIGWAPAAQAARLDIGLIFGR